MESLDSFAYSDRSRRSIAEDMAISGASQLPVLNRESGRICGIIGAIELLAARKRAVLRESQLRAFFRRTPQDALSNAELYEQATDCRETKSP